MKTHLLDSSEPITEGRSQTAICGATVNQAAFVFMWDEVEMGSSPQSHQFAVRLCSKCREGRKLEGRYIYGIYSGEELKERQREREAAV